MVSKNAMAKYHCPCCSQPLFVIWRLKGISLIMDGFDIVLGQLFLFCLLVNLSNSFFTALNLSVL
jgi:hypothetical protein